MTLLARPALLLAALALLLPATTAVAGDADAAGPSVTSATGDSDAPLSIYDDELRRFRFRVDHAVVTTEEALAFTVRYRSPENPEILGALPDAEDPSVLVVIGPPEAERAIRRVLAKSLIEMQGLHGTSIEMQKRVLVAERRSLIEDIASIEIARVGIDEEEARGRDQLDALDARLEAFEKEVLIVERKLEVVARNLERLRTEP